MPTRPLTELDELLTTEEVAEFCRTTPDTVRYWHENDKGPDSVKVGRRRLYARADVLEWLNARRLSATAGDAA